MGKIYATGLSGNALQKVDTASEIAVAWGLIAPGDLIDSQVWHEQRCVYLFDARRACNCDPTVTLHHILTAPGPNGLQ